MKHKFKAAIIGCGAVAEFIHLPVLKKFPEVKLELLVDRQLKRAEYLSQKFDIPNYSDNYGKCLNNIDIAIIAVPHHIHKAVAVEFLESGVHVLVEKPMALTVADCEEMIRTSEKYNAILTVGLVRRFYDNSIFIKQIIDQNIIGDNLHLEIDEGRIFNWKTASDYLFKKETGGGVLFDIGAHVIDLSSWWLGRLEVEQYLDDSLGGVEANCEIKLKGNSNSSATISLSRTRNLSNTIMIVGSKGELITGVQYNDPIALKINGKYRDIKISENSRRRYEDGIIEIFTRQLADFLNAIEKGKRSSISGNDGVQSISIIEECFKKRQVMTYPWEDTRLHRLEHI